MIIEICIGSSCHLKGSEDIVKLFEDSVTEYRLGSDVVLTGCFCTGNCASKGVTVKIDDKVYTGITKDNFSSFFKENVLTG